MFKSFALRLLFLSLFTLLIFPTTGNTQEVCSEKFDSITEACIRTKEGSMRASKIDFKNINEGDVYFYYTSFGNFGKFLVDAVYQDNQKCLLYITPLTFVNSKVAAPPDRLLEIQKKYNEWPGTNINLDTERDYASDLSITRAVAQNTCIMSSDNGYITKYMTIENGLVGGSEILYYAALGLIALAVYLVANAVFEEEDRFKASSQLEDADGDNKAAAKNDGFVLKYSRPFFKRYFSPIVQNMKNKKKIREKYKRKLATAGISKQMSPEDFYAFKLFLIIGFPVAFLGIRAFLEETWPMSMVPVMAVIGFFYPDIWLNSMMQKRKEAMVMGMPFIVDMLALSVEAGLDFVAAMTKVIEKAPPSPLAEEFETMIKEIKIGSSRAEGLRNLAWRCDHLSISSFTATLVAADSVGASIGPILKQLSAELRQKRSSEAEKKGATAATKILFPMMLFILPAVLITIAAPIAMQFMGSK